MIPSKVGICRQISDVSVPAEKRDSNDAATDTVAQAKRVFARGTCTLIINSDVTWTCYRRVSNTRKLSWHGYTFDSLLAFLTRDGDETDSTDSEAFSRRMPVRTEAMS